MHLFHCCLLFNLRWKNPIFPWTVFRIENSNAFRRIFLLKCKGSPMQPETLLINIIAFEMEWRYWFCSSLLSVILDMLLIIRILQIFFSSSNTRSLIYDWMSVTRVIIVLVSKSIIQVVFWIFMTLDFHDFYILENY